MYYYGNNFIAQFQSVEGNNASGHQQYNDIEPAEEEGEGGE